MMTPSSTITADDVVPVMASAQPQRALISPIADFWLLSGFSLLCIGTMWYLTDGHYDSAPWSQQVINIFFLGSFVVNQPHFAYSYQLFYNDFIETFSNREAPIAHKLRLALAGIAVPILLIMLLAYIWFSQSMLMLGWGLYFFMFLSGWHYVKQGYGVLITTSVYKSVFYGVWQKRILYANAYFLWLYAWAKLCEYAEKAAPQLYGVPLAVTPVPAWGVSLLATAILITSLLVVGIFLYSWRKQKKAPSFNGTLSYFTSCYIWMLAPGKSIVLAGCIPFFHSLQYLPFVYKFKKSEAAQGERKKNIIAMGFFAITGIVLGVLFFQLIPNLMDKSHTPRTDGFAPNFFFIAFALFINIHHFFIDHAFWRKDNKKVQEFLFKA